MAAEPARRRRRLQRAGGVSAAGAARPRAPGARARRHSSSGTRSCARPTTLVDGHADADHRADRTGRASTASTSAHRARQEREPSCSGSCTEESSFAFDLATGRSCARRSDPARRRRPRLHATSCTTSRPTATRARALRDLTDALRRASASGATAAPAARRSSTPTTPSGIGAGSTAASLDQQLDYWKQTLAGAPSRLELPTDFPRPPVRLYRATTRA